MMNLSERWKMTQLLRQGRHFKAVLLHYFRRCREDEIAVTAGHLAYVTLLSLVPMVAVSFAMFSAFPIFGELREQVEQFIYQNFVPTAGDVISQYMNDFVGKASKTTSVGIFALFIIAFMLMSSIDKGLNRIWRLKKKRRFIKSIPVYWMILTMGPMLAGASLALTSYLVGSSLMGEVSWLKSKLLELFPFLLSGTVILLLYLLVPNTTVKLKHGLAGALLAALLFEFGKRGFAVYIAKFTSYQAVYGALAAVPTLLVWIYFSWMIVLLGAELTASLGDYAAVREQVSEESDE